MNNADGSRGRNRRPCALAAAAAGVALLAAAQQRQLTSQALKFVACMRTHGLPAFPDPVVSAQGVSFRGPAGVGPNSSQFQSAQQACRKLLPGGPP
jgi:hypothetical protein